MQALAAERRAQMRSEHVQRLLGACGVEVRFEMVKTWSQLTEYPPVKSNAKYGKVVGKVLDFLKSTTDSILALVGTRGSGKTQMASTAVMIACRTERAARIVRTADLLLALKATFAKGSEQTEEGWLNEWCAPWLVVLDEFSVRLDTEWSHTILTHLIDKRYAAMKKTVLIANLTAAEFCAMAGSSVVDRARQGGGIVECTWPTLRGSK